MGVELEIDRGEDPEETASEIKCKQIYCKHDGSLEDNGVEIVTHPCSLEYHTHELGWEQVIGTARSHDYESHNAGTCGLHVHVNRTFFGETFDTQELNISKVIILVQRFWEQIVMFSRRRRGDINHWAKKPLRRKTPLLKSLGRCAAKRMEKIDTAPSISRTAIQLNSACTAERSN